MSAYTPPGSTINAHKAIQAEKAPISLVRKRCVCGVATTAKQLLRFKCCAKCYREKSHVVPAIYQIRNLANGRIYVGGSVNLLARWRSHKLDLNKEVHGNHKLQTDWNEYGVDSFEFSILEELAIDSDVPAHEQVWIDKLDAAGANGYNICMNSVSRLGVKGTPETIEKMRKAATGRKMSAESIEKTRVALTGRKQTPENIKKRADALKGRVFSIEHRRKLSEALTGKKLSPEHLEKMRAYRPSEESKEKNRIAHLGKVASPETKLKLSLVQMGRAVSAATLEKMRATNIERGRYKAVIATCIKTGQEKRFESAMDAERAGFLSQSISKVCKGQMHTHAGHYWRFADGPVCVKRDRINLLHAARGLV